MENIASIANEIAVVAWWIFCAFGASALAIISFGAFVTGVVFTCLIVQALFKAITNGKPLFSLSFKEGDDHD